jgi:hypothetical protein
VPARERKRDEQSVITPPFHSLAQQEFIERAAEQQQLKSGAASTIKSTVELVPLLHPPQLSIPGERHGENNVKYSAS